MSDDDVTMFVDGQVSDKEGNYNNYYNPVCVCGWVGAEVVTVDTLCPPLCVIT